MFIGGLSLNTLSILINPTKNLITKGKKMASLSTPLRYSKMNSLFLLRNTSSSLTSKRVTLNSISHIFSTDKFIPRNALKVSQIHSFTTSVTPSAAVSNWVNGNFGYSVRAFNVAATAFADLEEECDVDNGVGLEISKLGISEEIVSALAQRGITSLFPIQVFLLNCYNLLLCDKKDSIFSY